MALEQRPPWSRRTKVLVGGGYLVVWIGLTVLFAALDWGMAALIVGIVGLVLLIGGAKGLNDVGLMKQYGSDIRVDPPPGATSSF